MSAAVDWGAVLAELGSIEYTRDLETRRKKSRDFYWYSPILTEQLDAKLADLVVVPKTTDEVVRVAALCARRKLALTVRGAGTGNYGQCVPLEGGVVLDLTAMDRVLAIEPGWCTVEAGAILSEVDAAARRTGQMILMYPSTARVATVGGFIAGGHSGIGSIRHGILADPGNVRRIRVVTLEEAPRVIDLRDADIQKVHHAYGTNGIITELDIALAPAVDWLHLIACFPSYGQVLRFGLEAGGRCLRGAGIDVFLLSAVERRLMPYYKEIAALVRERDAMFAMVSPETLDAYRALVAAMGGEIVVAKTEREMAAAGYTLCTECAYNHTTLMALKVDRTVTYLQVAFPAPLDVALVEHFMDHFGDELYMHHEFSQMHGQLVSFALPLLHYFDRERVYEIIRYIEFKGCFVFDPHTYILEDGGMKVVDQAQIAFKRMADPAGLMNPGKTRGWTG
jgi:hypothetical protein